MEGRVDVRPGVDAEAQLAHVGGVAVRDRGGALELDAGVAVVDRHVRPDRDRDVVDGHGGSLKQKRERPPDGGRSLSSTDSRYRSVSR